MIVEVAQQVGGDSDPLARRYELRAYQWIPAKGPPPVPESPAAPINESVALAEKSPSERCKRLRPWISWPSSPASTPGPDEAAAYRTLIETS